VTRPLAPARSEDEGLSDAQISEADREARRKLQVYFRGPVCSVLGQTNSDSNFSMICRQMQR
jgi:hypothetical protein